MDLGILAEQAKKIATVAGAEILKTYKSPSLGIKLKSDNSPVTEADLASEKIIADGLNGISNYPIISEETYDIGSNHIITEKYYWLVDPLDGTKDFIAKNDEFTVNIALMENNKPVIGVVYLPALSTTYWAIFGRGAYKGDKKIFNNSERTDLIGAVSNFNRTERDNLFFKKYNITKLKSFGSSIKFCKLAEGEVDVYARFNGTKEWDTAAGQIIANEGGCKLVDVVTGNELLYNKGSIINNHFIASRNNLNFI